MTIILIGIVLLLTVLWLVAVRRSLAVMEENVNNAMCQIGVQIFSCFDVLTALLNVTAGCDAQESRTLMESVRSRRSAMSAQSSADDVRKQEGVIVETMRRVAVIAEQHPELKADETYLKCVSAVDRHENMVRTSCLIYNDSVSKLNRALRRFSASLAAGLLGIHQREYLEMAETDLP